MLHVHAVQMPVIRLFAYVFPKIYRQIYEEIVVDKAGVDRLRGVVAKGSPPHWSTARPLHANTHSPPRRAPVGPPGRAKAIH